MGLENFTDYLKFNVDILNKNPKGAAFEVHLRDDNAVDAAHGFTVINGKIPGYELPIDPKTGKPRGTGAPDASLWRAGASP